MHHRGTLLAALLNGVYKLVGLANHLLDKLFRVARALADDMIDGILLFLRHLAAFTGVELLQFGPPLVPLHLVGQRAVLYLGLGQSLIGACFFYACLALSVVGIQFMQIGAYLVPELLASCLLLFGVHPCACVCQVAGVKFVLYLQALGVIPLDNCTHVTRHTVLDGLLQGGIFFQYSLYIGIRL